MEFPQRRLIAAVVLLLSLLVVTYLVFFTPSETNLELPPQVIETAGIRTATTSQPGTPESEAKSAIEYFVGTTEREHFDFTSVFLNHAAEGFSKN